ncbi:hypothetical protein ACFLTN_06995 [Chloroflexota bacterium]
MHSKLLFLALTIAIPLILLASPIPIHAANITTTPASGTVGTSIQISGDGFAGRSATIHWDDQIILSKIPISETGELTCNLKVPSACRGDHVIKITDDSNWTASTASATFTVLPAITVSPRTSRPHTRITVIGDGFAASEKDIRITWDGTVLTTSATANAFGTWGINFDVPETNRGEHYIGAFSSSTDASEVDDLLFIVAPFAKVAPTSGPAGTEISVDGFGFRTGEDGITITWDGEIILCNIVGGADGSWSAKLNIPPCTKGYHTIGVYGSSFTPKGIVPDIEFNVVPHIELQPASGNKGAKVTVNGAGFANGETITLSFEEITLDSKAITDDAGSFSTAFEVPQSSVKDNKVKATGSAGNSAEAIFAAEKISPPTPALLSPPQGAKLKILDSFGDVFLGPAKRLMGIISYGDSRNQNSGPPIETFDWSDVNAEGKVTYTLQIVRGGDFSSQVLSKENLVDSEYDLTRNDISTKDIYSWRVKAVDDVGNESPWSEVQEFDLIPMSNKALILTLTIPILFIAAIVAVVILTWRKNRAKI